MFVIPVPASAVPTLDSHAAGGNEPGWTASWSDIVSYLMALAEEWFGPRDSRWFFTGIEFSDGDNPSTYYPGNRPFHVGIQLTRSGAQNPRQAYFQLAHEVVHLLGPSPTRDKANVLEEGMATLFQDHVSTLAGLGIPVTTPSYVHAMGEVVRLRERSRDAVRAIRVVHPDLRQVSDSEVIRIVPGLPTDLAASLCRRFAH